MNTMFGIQVQLCQTCSFQSVPRRSETVYIHTDFCQIQEREMDSNPVLPSQQTQSQVVRTCNRKDQQERVIAKGQNFEYQDWCNSHHPGQARDDKHGLTTTTTTTTTVYNLGQTHSVHVDGDEALLAENASHRSHLGGEVTSVAAVDAVPAHISVPSRGERPRHILSSSARLHSLTQ